MPVVPSRIRQMALPPFDPLNQRAAELRAAGYHVISLGQALPFFPPPAAALAGARAALDDPRVHLYSTDPGLASLRIALVDRLREWCAVDAAPADVIVTAGANHAFALAVTTLLSAGDDVLLPSPYFTNHEMMVRAVGATPLEVPLAAADGFVVRWSDIEPRLTGRTRAVVLCNPSNPTGAPLDAGEGERIVRALAGRDVFVICDETYMHFVYDGAHWSAASATGWRRNVVVVGTFSKSFGMMGFRVGFLLADAAICTEVIKVQDAMIICAPVVSQMAAEAAIRECPSYPASFHEAMLRRRTLFADGVRRIRRFRWRMTGGAFFGFVAVDGCTDSAALAQALVEEAHVVTIPGAAFGRRGEGHLRLSYGAASEEDLSEALHRLEHYFATA